MVQPLPGLQWLHHFPPGFCKAAIPRILQQSEHSPHERPSFSMAVVAVLTEVGRVPTVWSSRSVYPLWLDHSPGAWNRRKHVYVYVVRRFDFPVLPVICEGHETVQFFGENASRR